MAVSIGRVTSLSTLMSIFGWSFGYLVSQLGGWLVCHNFPKCRKMNFPTHPFGVLVCNMNNNARVLRVRRTFPFILHLFLQLCIVFSPKTTATSCQDADFFLGTVSVRFCSLLVIFLCYALERDQFSWQAGETTIFRGEKTSPIFRFFVLFFSRIIQFVDIRASWGCSTIRTNFA